MLVWMTWLTALLQKASARNRSSFSLAVAVHVLLLHRSYYDDRTNWWNCLRPQRVCQQRTDGKKSSSAEVWLWLDATNNQCKKAGNWSPAVAVHILSPDSSTTMTEPACVFNGGHNGSLTSGMSEKKKGWLKYRSVVSRLSTCEDLRRLAARWLKKKRNDWT
jgi:hypothetical protein